MSTAETELQPFGVVIALGPAVGQVETFYMYDSSAVLAEVNTVDEALTAIDEARAAALRVFPADVAAKVDAIWADTADAVSSGELTPAQVPAAWLWMRYNLGVSGVLSANAGGVPLPARFRQYALAHGWVPPEGRPAPVKPAIVHPSAGDTVTQWATLDVQGHQVRVAGFTAAETKAISKALALTFADSGQVTAAAIDRMLPGLAPGQVPEALTQLNTAAAVLERQVAVLRAEVGGRAPGHVAGQVSGLAETVHGLAQAVHILTEQIAEAAPSKIGDQVAANTKTIHAVSHTLEHTVIAEGLVGGVAVPMLAHDVANLNHLVDGISVGAVQHNLNTETSALRQEIGTVAKTSEECCAENSAITNPIRAGGATPSLLHGLGTLLKRAFELGFLVTLADGLLSVIDLPLAVGGVVTDTETIAGWAVSAAGVIEADFAWMGKLPR